LNGEFSIPAGKFYTLDIDLNPDQSVIYTPGQGYMLKPVITVTGSEINSGYFYYTGTYNNNAFVTAISPDGTMMAMTAQYPKYLITGYYVFDSLSRTLDIVPQQVTCPSCSTWEKLTMNLFADVPPASFYNVVTFGADYIDLEDSSNTYYHLIKVPTFALGYTIPAKQFTLDVTVPTTIGAGNTLVAQLVPQDDNGSVFGGISVIPDSHVASFDFTIPDSQFDSPTKNYVLLMAVVPDTSDLTLRSDGTVTAIQNVLAENAQNAVLLELNEGQAVTASVQVPFVPTN